LRTIDLLPPPHRDVSEPLRLPICDVIASHKLGQLAVCGKVVAGGIRTGSKVPFMIVHHMMLCILLISRVLADYLVNKIYPL
jgi:translation elongation factor EF-1alpha